MITVEQFKERGKALWKSQQSMARARYWKSGKRKGQERVLAQTIHFDEQDLLRFLWKTVGLNAIQCPYCSKPIDILSLTIDHKRPRALGGSFSLDNMECICRECNERKGKLTAEGYLAVVKFAREVLSPYDHDTLLSRLRAAAAHHGSFRPKAKGKPDDPQVFELPAF